MGGGRLRAREISAIITAGVTITNSMRTRVSVHTNVFHRAYDPPIGWLVILLEPRNRSPEQKEIHRARRIERTLGENEKAHAVR
jgi:hypothetical protein